ncbi:hypothetical protein ABZ858_16950 [Streptomyces sp. NPDC047017]
MKTAAAHRADAAPRAGRTAMGVLLVARLHVDLCRCMSAACRA